mgnify:CR=1 FL=1
MSLGIFSAFRLIPESAKMSLGISSIDDFFWPPSAAMRVLPPSLPPPAPLNPNFFKPRIFKKNQNAVFFKSPKFLSLLPSLPPSLPPSLHPCSPYPHVPSVPSYKSSMSLARRGMVPDFLSRMKLTKSFTSRPPLYSSRRSRDLPGVRNIHKLFKHARLSEIQ